LSGTGGGGEGVMKGVKAVMEDGRYRRRIWDEGRDCKICLVDTGGPCADKLTFGKGSDIDASLDVLR